MSGQRLGGWSGAAAVVVGISLVVPHAASGTEGAHSSCRAQWRVVATPSAALVAVATLSDTDVWAVGADKGSPKAHRSVIVHWDGAHLDLTPGQTGDHLLGIAAISPSDVWAVGYSGEGGLLEHWDGATWSREALPPRVGALDDIAMSSASSGWAVGTSASGHPLALRWDGTSWTRRTFENRFGWNGELYSVAGSSPNDVWAVGESASGPMVALMGAYAVHWDGRRWHEVRVPSRAGEDESLDVSAVSRTEAWDIHGGGGGRLDIQRWAGHRWRIVRQFPLGVNLDGVTALHGQAWAFGELSGHPALVHWNGRGWHGSHAPITSLHGTLVAGSALARQDIWAVGLRLVARYSC